MSKILQEYLLELVVLFFRLVCTDDLGERACAVHD